MAATKTPKEKLTLRDGVDLYLAVNQWIEDHIDEIELNGGALPDDLVAILDEVEASKAERADALAFKIDEFLGYATSAKATEDRAARRKRVWENVIKSMKAYGLYQVQRLGKDGRIEGTSAVLRIQKNSTPSTEVALTPEQMLELCDVEARNILVPGFKPHPLSPFISVTRIASIDTKALAKAYEARRDELVRESELLGVADIPDDIAAKIDGAEVTDSDKQRYVHEAIAGIRINYVTTHLASEFPGVTVQRGVHLRID